MVIDYVPQANFSASSTSFVEGETIDFTDLSIDHPDEWMWGFEGGDPAVSTDQNPTEIKYNTPGTFDVYLVSSNIFGSDSIMKAGYIYVSGVGIEENEILENAVYPNPTTGVFHIDLSNVKSENTELRIIDVKGNVVRSQNVNTSSVDRLTMDISDQSNGIYYVLIITNDKQHTIKTIKR